MYRFCLLDGLNGRKTSTVTLSKAPSTGRGNNGARLVFGDFFIAQSTHDLHQCSIHLKTCQTTNIVFLTLILESFVHSKMGSGDMIMYIKQNFVLHRLGNLELRKTITSTTFLATIEMIKQTVLTDIKATASQQNSSGFVIVAGQNVILDIIYHFT